jgi:hypothetical protein
MINLEPSDYQVVRRVADQRGLGDKGFSAALNRIHHKPDSQLKLTLSGYISDS